MIRIIHSAPEMHDWSIARSAEGKSIALVPTMGALHEGHLQLVSRAQESADCVVVSIFVNPTQFGPSEDFDAYPRTLKEDSTKLERQGMTSVIFAPTLPEIYPNPRNLTWVTVDRMGDHLCGESRPGHFRGVTTVVSRLFTIVEPTYGVFGLKDAQQFFILRRMARELAQRVSLIGVETVRESDGLARSSRNRYLNAAQRKQAPVLRRALLDSRDGVVNRGIRDCQILIDEISSKLNDSPECQTDYVQIVDTEELQPVETIEDGQQVLIAAAAFFGTARLIDNVIVRAGSANKEA